MSSSLLPFFSPRGVVVVGASTSSEKLGYGVARNLVQSGYPGAIHFVSQKQGALFGRALHTDLAQVPDPVDLAVLVVPSTDMPEVIRDCVKRGIHAAILVSSGFREAGLEGAALESQCLEIARAHGVRLLGPNCIGTLDTHLPLDTTFLQPPMPARGGIAFISHSGAFCAAIIDWARGQGFGFSQLVSLGNQADVNETDVLPLVASDGHTRVVALYMEGVSDGRRFVETARAVTRVKPVVALKVGRFESGQKAAASHTGALAASDTAFEAAFAKAGILRAETAEQMFDWARALEVCPLPRGRKFAILTNAGGPGVIAADALEINGLTLAKLGEATRQSLSDELPRAAAVHNPVDMLASASPDIYAACLKHLLFDQNVDGVMAILPPPPMFTTEQVADALIPIIHASEKPVVVALMGSDLTATAYERFNQAQVVTYPFPERAASALGILAKRAEALARWSNRSEGAHPDFAPTMVSIQQKTRTRPSSPDELVASYGIPTAPIKLARNVDEAAVMAEELGFPVVMKIASPDVLHKSDVGGVLLDIKDRPSAQIGYAQLVNKIMAKLPKARVDGVHLQHQAAPGQEVIAGMVRDVQFGPLIMFGSGGIEVEGLKDVAFALAPLDPSEARAMIHKTWAGRKLAGFRSLPPADEEAVIQVLVNLSRLGLENEEVEEIEINPLRVFERGTLAIDVRWKLAERK